MEQFPSLQALFQGAMESAERLEAAGAELVEPQRQPEPQPQPEPTEDYDYDYESAAQPKPQPEPEPQPGPTEDYDYEAEHSYGVVDVVAMGREQHVRERPGHIDGPRFGNRGGVNNPNVRWHSQHHVAYTQTFANDAAGYREWLRMNPKPLNRRRQWEEESDRLLSVLSCNSDEYAAWLADNPEPEERQRVSKGCKGGKGGKGCKDGKGRKGCKDGKGGKWCKGVR
jgi:hypothetical protein